MAYNRQRSAGFKNGQPLGDRTKFDAPRRKKYEPEGEGRKAAPRREDRAPSAKFGRPAENGPEGQRPPRAGGARQEERFAPPPVREAAPEELPYLIFGRNPVKEAIKSGRSIDRILVTAAGSEDGSLREIVRMARDAGVVVAEVTRAKLDELTLPFGYAGRPAAHQGIVARMPECEYCDLDAILDCAKERGEDPFVIVLDCVNDPHNLGSILRTAECVGAHGVVIPKRRAASVTGTVAKASAGAVSYQNVARVANLGAAIDRLKKEGLWIAGADMQGVSMESVPMKGPFALVIGGEDEGLSRVVKERCDFLAAIPMRGHINSLNASVAAAVLMYEKRRQDGWR